MLLTRPRKDLRDQLCHQRGFVFRLVLGVVAAPLVVWLIPYIPRQDAVIVCERTDNALYEGLQPWILRSILKRLRAGALHPAGVMHAGNRRPLRARLEIRIPARVEQHE